jgi:hypothetical protein
MSAAPLHRGDLGDGMSKPKPRIDLRQNSTLTRQPANIGQLLALVLFKQFHDRFDGNLLL